MTDSRDPGAKLLHDVVRFKRQRNEAQVETARLAALIADLQIELIALRVRGRLLRFEDFHHHIGVEQVLHPDGRVNHRKLDLMVTDLVRRRPELAAPRPNVGPSDYAVADGADTVSDLLQTVKTSPVGNTQQSRARA